MDVPENLIELQRASNEARAKLEAATSEEERREQREAWRMCAEAVQAAITQHAVEQSLNRYELGQAVKDAARQPEA
ncbi:hypothetical protein [Streptomyces sp. DH37]|uniref:hypothetical protein n=1 Tax=Streptomyces sp. DH37 TaxID=3040122 RepID=UPI00244243BB|nr:hypothetical protein [Streptomyces sp. DH37]MDG9701646.1 hypothetical protein [Streptomyces sp. DH37]